MTTKTEPYAVYTFSSAWGIPVLTASPFGVKLLTWLRMHDIPHEVHAADNPTKGPKGKVPWAVVDGKTIGDSQLIIDAIRKERGIVDDEHLTARQKAIATSTRLMLEDHYHQVWEYELFIQEAGWQLGLTYWDVLPPVVRVLIRNMARRALQQQLHARGIGRHSRDEIIKMGIDVLDTVDELLGDGPFFLGDEPSSVDATVFGFMALTKWTHNESPVWDHFRERRRLGEYCERMRERYFAG